MKRNKGFLVVLGLYFLTVSSFAGAQHQEVDLQPIVITAARMEQSSGQYGANVTVLGKKEIEASGATNTAELIDSASGVFVTQKSTAKTSVVDIRGFGDTADRNVLVLVNGRKINNVDNAAPDLLSIPIEAVERVEIIRGAGSVLYGDNAVGGVINIITKKGRGPVKATLGATAGSYQSRSVFSDISGSLDELSYYFFARQAEDNGYRANSDVQAKDFNGRVDYKISDRLSVGADLTWHDDAYGIPGGLNASGLSTYGRRGSDEEENYGKTSDLRAGLSASYQPWSSGTDGKIVMDYSFRNQDTYGWYDYGIWGALGTKRSIDTHALLTKYIHQGEVAGRKWDTVIGIDFYDVENDILGSGTGISASTDDLTISKKETGFYGYGELEVISKVFTGIGIRYQQADYTFDQRAGFAAPGFIEKDPNATVKKALIRYEYADKSNVYVSVEETFRFLSTDEWYSTWTGLNMNLQHQTGIQYELGWKHNFNTMAQVSVVPYWIETDNEIFLNPAVSPGINSNYDEIRRQGVEVSSHVDLKRYFGMDMLRNFQLKTSYHYQHAEFQAGAYEGYRVPMVPQHQARAGISAEWGSGWGIVLSEEFIGSRFVINDVDNVMPKEKGYFLTNIKVFCKKENWEVFAAVNNVLSRKYNEYAARSTGGSTNIAYYPASERNIEVGMKVKF